MEIDSFVLNINTLTHLLKISNNNTISFKRIWVNSNLDKILDNLIEKLTESFKKELLKFKN